MKIFSGIVSCLFLLFFCSTKCDPKQDNRIVGGTVARIRSFPYQVSLLHFNYLLCGGSIIAPQYILTAAHCVEKSPYGLSVRAGSSTWNRGGVVIKVCSQLVHHLYNDTILDYDVAILMLCRKLPYSRTIQPIALANSGDQIGPQQVVSVSGWGSTSENGSVITRLRQVKVLTIDQELCKRLYRQEVITPRMFCAGNLFGGKDSCQGDSGGPLVYKNKLIGIVSWGNGCGRSYSPGVYTKVSEVRCWIKARIGV